MARYIDANLTNTEILNAVQEETADAETFITVRRILNKLPTADVVPVVHAHWIGDPIPEENFSILTEYSVSRTCSHCGYSLNVVTELTWHYCPNCGARMDEKVE